MMAAHRVVCCETSFLIGLIRINRIMWWKNHGTFRAACLLIAEAALIRW